MSQILTNHFDKLVECLPMDDTLFITKLITQHLLPGDTENKINALPTQADKALYFLNHVIKPALVIDDMSGFKKLLSVMQDCGYHYVQKLSSDISEDIDIKQAGTSFVSENREKLKPESTAECKALRAYKEKFSEDDVESSFSYLVNKLEALWSDVDFSELKKICKRDNRLSNELRSDVKKSPDLEETLDLLTTSPFCTWLELRILKRMAKVADVPEATDMINVFEECVHKRKCSEVQQYFRKEYINPDHLTLVVAKLNKSADDLIVSDLINYCHKLESICRIPAESGIPISSEKGCLEICFAIPTYCCLYAYEIAKSDFFKLRPVQIRYLQIGIFPRIYAVGQKISMDCSFLKWISSSFDKFSDHTEVISYYYPYLLKHMDADSVSHMMHCQHLITDDDYEAITAAPNDNMMNAVILEYVRAMDLPTLFKFADLLNTMETQKSIGNSLEFSLKLIDQNSSGKWSVASTDFKNFEDETIKSHKLQLMFLNLIDKLILHMFTADVIMLVNCLDNISLFEFSLIEKMKNKPYPFTFKIYLLPFLSWFDHSILEELVKSSRIKNAIWLVKQFKLYIDYNQPITSCVPEFSHLMIPNKGDESEYTLLVTKHFNKRHNEMVMHDLLNIKKELTSHWKITHHALHLVALHKALSYFYWIIPGKLCSLINKRDQVLWNKGITIVAILPDDCLPYESSLQNVGCKQEFLNFSTVDVAEEYFKDSQIAALMKKYEEIKTHNVQLSEEITDGKVILKIKQSVIDDLKKDLKSITAKYQELKSNMDKSTAVTSDDLKTDLKEDKEDKEDKMDKISLAKKFLNDSEELKSDLQDSLPVS